MLTHTHTTIDVNGEGTDIPSPIESPIIIYVSYTEQCYMTVDSVDPIFLLVREVAARGNVVVAGPTGAVCLIKVRKGGGGENC